MILTKFYHYWEGVNKILSGFSFERTNYVLFVDTLFCKPEPYGVSTKLLNALKKYFSQFGPTEIYAYTKNFKKTMNYLNYGQLEVKDISKEEKVNLPIKEPFFLKSIKIPRLFLDSYVVFVALPKMESSTFFGSQTMLFEYVRNNFLFGLPMSKFDEIIADINSIYRPELVFYDARYGVVDNSSRTLNLLAASQSPYFIDAYFSNLLGTDPKYVGYFSLLEKEEEIIEEV
jgi:uncharacterized protein (DUF362 family)